MRLLQLEQGTDDWHAWRRARICASEIAAVCGIDPYKSAYDVWLDKVGLSDSETPNEDMQRGITLEPEARDLINKSLGIKFNPACVESETLPLGASLDGIYNSTTAYWICEIKCPREKGHQYAEKGMIPDRYQYQMQQQLLITKAELCFFCSYFNGSLAVIEVMPDLAIQDHIIEESQMFWRRVQEFDPPQPPIIEREDDDFNNWAVRWKEHQLQKCRLESQEKQLRQEVQKLTEAKSSKGFGISVNYTPRKGNLDHERLIKDHLQSIDLESYRKPSSTVMSIREYEKNTSNVY